MIDCLGIDESVTHASPGKSCGPDTNEQNNEGESTSEKPPSRKHRSGLHALPFQKYRKSAPDYQTIPVASRPLVQYLGSMNPAITPEAIRSAFGTAKREAVTLEGYWRAGVLVPLVFAPTGIELLFT